MPEPTYQALPFPVRVKRWFEDPRYWVLICGNIATVGPIALNLVAGLGIPPWQLLLWTVGLNVLIHNANIYLAYRSTSVIGNKDEVATSKASP
jgi:hypothetical protein